MELQTLESSLLEINEQINIVKKQYNDTIQNPEYIKFINILDNNYNQYKILIKKEKRIKTLIENIAEKNIIEIEKS
jgi:hypothetical protein